MRRVGYGSRVAGMLGMAALAAWAGFKVVDAALVAFFFPPKVEPVKLDRCPECGGKDYFDGYGVCQECEIF